MSKHRDAGRMGGSIRSGGILSRFAEIGASREAVQKGARAQSGAALFVVLAVGVVLAIVLTFVLFRSGQNRKDSVKNMKSTREFYLADAGFNFIKTRVTVANREGGVEKVRAFLDAQRAADWQQIGFGGTDMGFFRLSAFKMVDVPLTVDFVVEGSRKPNPGVTMVYESVQGVLRVPSLARYARYVEGNSELYYTPGTVVDGEILAAGGITLTGSTVTFTRMVSTGEVISNRPSGQYDFGFRENQKDIPTLNHVHINSRDNYLYNGSKYASTFQYFSDNGGINLMGRDAGPTSNPAWNNLNGTGACSGGAKTGPCDTLFTGCYDTLSAARRSPVVVVGSAVAIDLSQITMSGSEVSVVVSPVIYDAGGDGKDYFTLGTPSRTYKRPYSTFKGSAVIYFPGDIYLTGQLRGVPVTIVSGDDVFLHGSFIGPVRTEVDGNKMPVTLGIVAQDRVYIHESSSKTLTVRAAILAENDEIIYDDDGTGAWKYGYVCRREIFASPPAKGAAVSFATYFDDNFIWDDYRVRQAGFGREPEEECKAPGVCPSKVLETYGFAALAYPRTGGANWKLTFEGSLITREPGSKGPKDDCNLGWDCDIDPNRATWAYDDNLGVAYPPKFPAPVVDDRNPTQIVGFKRKSY